MVFHVGIVRLINPQENATATLIELVSDVSEKTGRVLRSIGSFEGGFPNEFHKLVIFTLDFLQLTYS